MIKSASIRAKLTIVVMITTCASLGLMGLELGLFEFFNYRHMMKERMAVMSDIIGANSTAALSFNDEAAARETLRTVAPQQEIRRACLYDAKGRLFASFLRVSDEPRCPASPSTDGAGFDGARFWRSGPVLLEADRIGTLSLVASQSSLWQSMALFAGVLALAAIASLATGLLVSTRLQRIITVPLLDLAATARRISSRHDYALRAPQRGQDEVGVAVLAFNIMLDRIQAADQALRTAEQKSREQAQFLGSIVDSIGEGMIVLNRAGEVLVWNAAATRLVGPRPRDVALVEWTSYFRVVDATSVPLPAEQLPLARALRGEAVGAAEFKVGPANDRDGVWVSTTAHPWRDDQGRIAGAIAVFRDVTQQKQAELDLRASEAQLRQAQKMEAIGQLAGGIAHDFNNLLTVICGYCHLALDALPTDAPLRMSIEEVLSAGNRAAALTRQLLAFSRHQVLEPQLLDMNSVVSASRQMLRRLITEDVELETELDANPTFVLADPGQMDQVILNLVVNARDAMPDGGRILVETRNVELDAQHGRAPDALPPGSYVRLSVKDTGSGMTPEVQARIFEPFFTTKEVGRGTGLGLSTVYGIVRQSGGAIDVSSAPGQGTTFNVYLPKASGQHRQPGMPVSKSEPQTGGRETILLVEDESSVRNFAQKILTDLGYQVLVANDGLHALDVEASFTGVIQLLLSDVVMPKLSGPELAGRLGERRPELRVLFISGHPRDARFEHGLLGTQAPLIPKPFTPDGLARAVREVLNAPPRNASGRADG